MRPVDRRGSPQATDFQPYRTANPHLRLAIGEYCSYCERVQRDAIHVEHIQPKGLPQYARLVGTWTNFLLACPTCNRIKGRQDVTLDNVFLPDRDNTFAGFRYRRDGRVEPAVGLDPGRHALADATLTLTGQNKRIREVAGRNGKQIVFDRTAHRMEVRGVAEVALHDLATDDSLGHRRSIQNSACGYGCFSIWMDVFAGDVDMRQRFIRAFRGTARDCFDPLTTAPIRPRPPVAGLAHSGKV